MSSTQITEQETGKTGSAVLFAKAKANIARAEHLRSEKWKATLSLRKQIEAMEKPFDEEILKANVRASELSAEGRKVEGEELMQLIQQSGKAPATAQEFKKWFDVSADMPFDDEYHGGHGSQVRASVMDVLKRAPKIDGLTVFAADGYGTYNYYVAFKGSKVYAYMSYKKSRHVGDGSFVNQAGINGVDVKSQFQTKSHWSTDVVKPVATWVALVEASLK